jgi:hypothetical protein
VSAGSYLLLTANQRKRAKTTIPHTHTHTHSGGEGTTHAVDCHLFDVHDDGAHTDARWFNPFPLTTTPSSQVQRSRFSVTSRSATAAENRALSCTALCPSRYPHEINMTHKAVLHVCTVNMLRLKLQVQHKAGRSSRTVACEVKNAVCVYWWCRSRCG